MAYVIEDGIPLVEKESSELLTALRSMCVGQSVLVPGKTSREVSSEMRVAKRGTEKYFQSKTLTTGVRIWRLE